MGGLNRRTLGFLAGLAAAGFVGDASAQQQGGDLQENLPTHTDGVTPGADEQEDELATQQKNLGDAARGVVNEDASGGDDPPSKFRRKLLETLEKRPLNLIVIGDASMSYSGDAWLENTARFEKLAGLLRPDFDYLQAYVLGIPDLKGEAPGNFGFQEEVITRTGGNQHFDESVREEVTRKLRRRYGQGTGQNSDNLAVLRSIGTNNIDVGNGAIPAMVFFWDGEPNSMDDIAWQKRYPELAGLPANERLARYHAMTKAELERLRKLGVFIYIFPPPNAALPPYARDVADFILEPGSEEGAFERLLTDLERLNVRGDVARLIEHGDSAPPTQKLVQADDIQNALQSGKDGSTAETHGGLDVATGVTLAAVLVLLIGLLAMLRKLRSLKNEANTQEYRHELESKLDALSSLLREMSEKIAKLEGPQDQSSLVARLDAISSRLTGLYSNVEGAKNNDIDDLIQAVNALRDDITKLHADVDSAAPPIVDPRVAELERELAAMRVKMEQERAARGAPAESGPQISPPPPEPPVTPTPPATEVAVELTADADSVADELQAATEAVKSGKEFPPLPNLAAAAKAPMNSQEELRKLVGVYQAFSDLLVACQAQYTKIDAAERYHLDPYLYLYSYRDHDDYLRAADVRYGREKESKASFRDRPHPGCIEKLMRLQRDAATFPGDAINKLLPYRHYFNHIPWLVANGANFNSEDPFYRDVAVENDVYMQCCLFDAEKRQFIAMKWKFANGVCLADFDRKPLQTNDPRLMGNIEIAGNIPSDRSELGYIDGTACGYVPHPMYCYSLTNGSVNIQYFKLVRDEKTPKDDEPYLQTFENRGLNFAKIYEVIKRFTDILSRHNEQVADAIRSVTQ